MKAEITKDGCLRITPQSDLEAYALGKWKQAGSRKTHGVLEVLTEPDTDGWTTGVLSFPSGPLTLSNPRSVETISGEHFSCGTGTLVTTSDGMCP